MSNLAASSPRNGLNEYGRRRLVQVFAMLGLYALCLFLAAGTLRWWNAWVYLGLFAGAILTAGMYVVWRNPAIVNERGRPSSNTKLFDRLFGAIYGPLGLATLILAGLDYRFGWSAVPLWLTALGFAGVVPGMLMPYWVMYVNSYAATTVRVETDRGQRVITNGPYRIVRHPMYSTTILSNLFLPLALGSWWLYVPALLLNGLIIWRTANEDKTLRSELPGYADYANRTQYRILPGIW